MNIPRKLAVVFIALGSVSVAQAEVPVFDNFGPNDSYDGAFGWQINSNYTQGMQFTASGTGALSSVQLAFTNVPVGSSVTLELFSDSGGTLGALIETLSFSSTGGAIETALASGSSLLTAGTDYWLVGVYPSDGGSWQWNNTGGVGLLARSFQGGPFTYQTETQSAFRVNATPVAEPVTIDIKPGGDTNCFDINGHGVIPVAVLSSESFDAATIDVTTLSFGELDVRVKGSKEPQCSLEDMNFDGLNDLVCKFQNSPEYWDVGDDEATLTGALLDGTEIEGTGAICSAVNPTSPVPKTGAALCGASDGTTIPCEGTGQDGEFQAGVDSPSPRFTDNGDGTVTDLQTGLTWTKAYCNGNSTGPDTPPLPWGEAQVYVTEIENGVCGLSDGSAPGDWRLPNILELISLIDWGTNHLPDGHPFTRPDGSPIDGPIGRLWSSTTNAGSQWEFGKYYWQVVLGAENVIQKENITNILWGGTWPVKIQ